MTQKKNQSDAHLELCGFVLAAFRQNHRPSRLAVSDLEKTIEKKVGPRRPNLRESLNLALEALHPLVVVMDGIAYPSSEIFRKTGKSFFTARSETDRHEKRAVAIHICHKLIEPLSSIFMDGGSACAAIAREMVYGKPSRFTVMTNNMVAIREFRNNPSIRIAVTGGFFNVEDEALLGKAATFDHEDFSVRWAIVGASGLTATYVYNHGITGEEEIKKAYWQIPADHLVVPASLRKFGGKDACCFGELFRSPLERDMAATGNDGEDAGTDIHRLAEEENEIENEEQRAALIQEHSNSKVPRFKAKECLIVIEPEWMIEKHYKGRKEEKEGLQSTVDRINRNSQSSHVRVVHAEVDENAYKKCL